MSNVKITPNAMSSYDQATYHLTLYLVHEDLFNAPEGVASYLSTDSAIGASAEARTLQRGDKAVIIAESGVTGGYAIDNLLMLSRVTPGATHGNTTTGTFQFDLFEPLGFKLVDRITQFGGLFNHTTVASAKYVLKIEFLGRDPATQKPLKHSGQFFFPFVMTQIRASMGPDGTRYNVVAANIMKTTLVESVVVADVIIGDSGATVQSFCSAVETALNKYEVEIRKTTTSSPPPKKYWKIKFSDRAQAKIAGKSFSAIGNDALRAGSAVSSNGEFVATQITANTNLVTYLAEILTRNTPSFALEAKTARENADSMPIPTIMVEPTIEYGDDVDQATNMPEQTIILTIDIYETWVNALRDAEKQRQLLNSSGKQKQRFELLPIVKRYDYLYTGQTQEVINFDLNFEQLFFVARDPTAGMLYSDSAETLSASNPQLITAAPSAARNKTPDQMLAEYNRDLDNAWGSESLGARTGLLSSVVAKFSSPLEMPRFDFQNMGADKQRKIENQPAPELIEAIRDREYAVREYDFLNVEIDIKGDPFWLGTPGSKYIGGTNGNSLHLAGNHSTTDALVTFITFNPDESLTMPGPRTKGEMNLSASGVYKITEVESKLQGGKFVQTIKGYRDPNTSTYMCRDLILNKGAN